jgi:hypothetical protein
MADTNDIDALLDLLAAQSRFGFHSALTALVAERDELQRRNDALRKGIDACVKSHTELEERSKPLYIAHGQRVESIDLRERLVCAALAGFISAPREFPESMVVNQSVRLADLMIAAMRKGESDGK